MTKEEILAGESERLEFNRDVPEQSVKYIKTVVAFANGKGGTIVFGVDDKTHKIEGLKKSEVFQKADSIADTIFQQLRAQNQAEHQSSGNRQTLHYRGDSSFWNATALFYKEHGYYRRHFCSRGGNDPRSRAIHA